MGRIKYISTDFFEIEKINLIEKQVSFTLIITECVAGYKIIFRYLKSIGCKPKVLEDLKFLLNCKFI